MLTTMMSMQEQIHVGVLPLCNVFWSVRWNNIICPCLFFFASAWQTILALHLSTTFSTSCAEKLASFSGLPRFCSDVIHVIGVPRPSPFFATLPLPCIVLNANKTGEIREWGYWATTELWIWYFWCHSITCKTLPGFLFDLVTKLQEIWNGKPEFEVTLIIEVLKDCLTTSVHLHVLSNCMRDESAYPYITRKCLPEVIVRKDANTPLLLPKVLVSWSNHQVDKYQTQESGC